MNSVAYNPDGKRIVSGSHDARVKVWNTETGQVVFSLTGHRQGAMSVSYSPDGKRIVSGSHDKTVKVWDAEKGRELFTLKGHTYPVLKVSYSADGKRINSRDETGKVLTWDAITGQLLADAKYMARLEQTKARSPDGSQFAFIDNGELKVVFSPDFVQVQKRQQALDRAFLARLARPDPAYHRQRADQYEKSGDLFAAAFHLRRLLKIERNETVRKRLAAVESKLAAQVKIDANLPQKPPAKMSYAD